MTPLLEIDDLRIEGQSEGDSWFEIVKGVSLTLKRGEVLGLIGESGAGKSTIGLASMGYARSGCRISGGSIRLNEQELFGAPHETLRKIRGVRVAYVAQSAAAAFNPAHTLNAQVCEAAVTHGVMSMDEALKNAKRLYAKLRLPNPETFGDRYPHQVSGGQLQRAMTAMAMVCKPHLIVFDEPTTALDVTTQIEVLAAIKDAIRDEGTAALYITHDLAVVAQIADRIMVLRHGTLVEEGPTGQILHEPKQAYTKALVNVRRVEGEATHRESGPPVLEARNLTAGYDRSLLVLKDVSIALESATTLAVVGESGSGKSTLARVLTGLLPPIEGETVFAGETLSRKLKDRTKEQLRRLQMIYQMPDVALNPRQKVEEILGRPLTFYFGRSGAARRKRVEELLEWVELPRDFAQRYPSELSGGQKQRVCIARALAAEPTVIICDEVTSALDPVVADGVLRLLLRIQNETGLAYVFITHDLATVKAIADSIVVMYQGEIVQQGPKAEVLTPPHHPYTDLLLSSVPEMDTNWLDAVLAERARRKAQGEKVLDSAGL
ncbi:ABC transporter ATP-binding protein [Rhodospirillaceae bacterium SYSU D60014]|uniref:ABC transporter ATP-binding protein n=1 Tax=Virgifigura deserti TaxID=2268457 RepID=UPI000E663DBB